MLGIKFDNFSYQKISLILVVTAILNYLTNQKAQAQVIEDGTLSTEVSTEDQRNFTVNGGEQRGGNLFHSFEQFSVPQNGSVSFNNALTIQNIITRVTGSSISNINGLIQNNGTASLFLINPNGIIFGENARLNIGGSFIGTTAESLVFEGDRQFSSNLTDSKPLLTMNVPLGLQFGSNPGKIINQANFSVPNPVDPTSQIKLGLSTLPGTSLALLGGDIRFDGGATSLPTGNIELGSVAENSFVALAPQGQQWTFNYDSVSQFRDLIFDNLAAVDSSGLGTGDISIRGKTIKILGGSAISSNNLGDIDGGKITIQAAELVEINGSDRTNTKIDPLLASIELFIPFASQVSSNTLGQGKGGDVSIVTQDLKLIDGGSIELQTLPGSTGKGGSLSVLASESIQLSGARPLLSVGENAQDLIIPPSISLDMAIEFNLPSEILVLSISDSDGGNLDLAAKNLQLLDGATIGITPFSSGNGGEINLDIEESIDVIGTSARTGSASSKITANTFAAGNSGTININSNVLNLQDGGQIASSTFSGTGNTGKITINTNSLKITGISQSQRQSLLSTNTRNSSDGGDIIINTDNLSIADSGLLDIKGTGTGAPGNLILNARNVELSNNARINAENSSAIEGGNISLQIQEQLILKENSSISAQAFNSANGGNVTIDTDFLIAFPNQNNDILANAFTGSGGKINITAKGVFGIAEGKSQQSSLSNDLDASSEFGLEGNVTLLFPQFTTTEGLFRLDSDFVNVNNLLENNFCKLSRDSQYLVTGRGGIPLSPEDDFTPEQTWSDWRILGGLPENPTKSKMQAMPKEKEPVEPLEMIQGWTTDRHGKIVLTANPVVATPQSSGLGNPNCNY